MSSLTALLMCYAAIIAGLYVVIDATFALTSSAWLRLFVIVSLCAICLACVTAGEIVTREFSSPAIEVPLIPFEPADWRTV